MEEKNRIYLRGLTGSSPIGAMAAFGTLKICSRIPEIESPKLMWAMDDDWIAVLQTDNVVDEKEVPAILHKYLEENKKITTSILKMGGSADIRTYPDKLHDTLQRILEKSSYSGREELDYWAAFTTENAVDRSKGLSKPSDLYMISGNQSFAKKVMDLYDNTDERLINEALYGTWKYAGSHGYSMGWDPATLRMHSFRKKAPTDDTSPLCEIGAEWLAFHSLPLFPVFSSQGRAMTTGFERDRFIWPIWESPVSYDTLRTLVQSLGSTDMGLRNGISAFYRSYRISMAKGYGAFTPAEPVKIR